MILYNGCLVAHKSQMQTDIALSTTEAEFTGLSSSLRETIPIIRLLKEMREKKFPIISTTADIKCKVFEDNSGAIELATVFKTRPRTKHINTRMWHFMSYVENGDVKIHACKSEDMPADILTKPTNQTILEKHRKTIQGWQIITKTNRVKFASPLERECSIIVPSADRLCVDHIDHINHNHLHADRSHSCAGRPHGTSTFRSIVRRTKYSGQFISIPTKIYSQPPISKKNMWKEKEYKMKMHI